MTAPKPIAQGTLAKTPFAHVLISLMRKGLEGTLAVWPDDDRPGQDRIFFRNGNPMAGRFVEAFPSLERGMLTIFQRERAGYGFYEGNLVGRKDNVLRGRVDPLALIASALRGGMRDDVVNEVLRKLGDTPQRIRSGAPIARLNLHHNEKAFIELMRAEPAPPRNLIEQFGDPEIARRILYLLAISQNLEEFTKSLSQRRVKAVHVGPIVPSISPANLGTGLTPSLPPLSGAPAARSSVPPKRGSTPARSSLTPEERSYSPPPTFDSKQPPSARSSLTGEVYAPRSVPPPPPQGLSEEMAKRWNEIRHAVTAIDRQNFFQMLGVKETAETHEVQERYLKLVKHWHPDRLPKELEDVRPFVDEIFDFLTQARDTLADSARRTAYQKTLTQGGGTPETDRKIMAILDAAQQYQKVEVLIQRRKWDEAIEILDRNMGIAPKEPDYPAMKAWALFNRDGIEDEDALGEVNALLRKAFTFNPAHVHAHFVRANVLKRQGEFDRALQHFKKVVEADPRNLEAAREVRIGTVRQSRGRSSAPPTKGKAKSGGGLLGKFFGGDKKK